MGLILVILGLLLSGYGAALMLVSGGAVAGRSDGAGLRRARWRSRRALALLASGVVLVVIGALVLPLRNRLAGLGTGGVLVLIFCDVLALVLNAVGIVLVSMNGVAWGHPANVDEPWLDRAQRRTRIGLVVLFAGIVAQLAAVAVIAL
jgi:hypothetical protein